MYYSEQQIHETLEANTNAFMDMLERFYLAWQNNDALVSQPKKQLFETQGIKGGFRVMPCIIKDFEGATIKAVKVIGTNEEEQTVHDKICVGKALLINTTDNYVEGIFDVSALSSFRTAAISVLAFKHTSSSNQDIGLIGAGRIGYYTALILSKWLGAHSIHVTDINVKMTQRFENLLKGEIIIAKAPLEELCSTCTTVFLSTNSQKEILTAANAQSFTFISSVGADASNLSELHHDLIKGRMIISESRQNIYFGDMNRWYKRGMITEEDVTELKDIIGLDHPKKPILFISTGAAVQDALICHFLKTSL